MGTNLGCIEYDTVLVVCQFHYTFLG